MDFDFVFDFDELLLLLDFGFLVREEGRLVEIFCRSNFRT